MRSSLPKPSIYILPFGLFRTTDIHLLYLTDPLFWIFFYYIFNLFIIIIIACVCASQLICGQRTAVGYVLSLLLDLGSRDGTTQVIRFMWKMLSHSEPFHGICAFLKLKR